MFRGKLELLTYYISEFTFHRKIMDYNFPTVLDLKINDLIESGIVRFLSLRNCVTSSESNID